MDSELVVEALPILGVCNLCLNEGAVKSMLASNFCNGINEIYAEMLTKCFSIDITTLELGDTKRLVCDGCIMKLRDCSTFRELVEASLQTLQCTVRLCKESKATVVKTEYVNTFDDDDDYDLLPEPDNDDDDEDYKIPIKIEIKKPKTTKTKSKIKKKKKSPQDLAEIEALLSAGLFPFKMKKDEYACFVCTEKSPELEEIRNHVTEHNRSTIRIAFNQMIFNDAFCFYKLGSILRCKICTADIKNFEELKKHLTLETCSLNKYKHSKSSKWNKLPFKLEKDQLDCPICKKTFLNYVSLNTHMNIHYPNYICESCGKAFASKARLRGHMRTHEEGSFPCRYCPATFDRVTKRENHVSKEHKSGIRYACKRCNISLTSFYARQKHLAEIHNEELKRYKCKACPQSYITPGHLSSHVRRDHLNERNHKCDKCDLAFYTKNALKMHQIKHDGERIHTCSICQKSYQRKKTLREHMRIHDNDKRFVCPVCGRAFTQKCTLKGHLRVHERKVDVEDRIVIQPLQSM